MKVCANVMLSRINKRHSSKRKADEDVSVEDEVEDEGESVIEDEESISRVRTSWKRTKQEGEK
jgi:hypothetical protein